MKTLALIAMLLLCGCGKKPAQTVQRAAPPVSSPTTKTETDGWVLLCYGSRGCPACRTMLPIVEALKAEPKHGGFDHIYIIDVDANADLPEVQAITAIPCFVVALNGKEISRHTGVCKREALISWLTQ